MDILSPSTRSQEKQTFSRKNGNEGFSLLEVIVALAIMAVGFVTVMQLFSGSVRSAGLSEQYLKAVTLARSKLNALELSNFGTLETGGSFENEDTYRWELDISPYDSPLNAPESNINLNQITLNVIWEDGSQTRNVEFTTLRLTGQTFPLSDADLTSLFSGGPGTISRAGTAPEPPTAEQPATVSTNISGVVGTGGNVSGAVTPHVSGN